MTGFYQMHRGWMEHPIFSGAVFCKRAAWVWLIENAAWKTRRVRVSGGNMVTLERGQLSHSTRYMAATWGWSEAKVRRFLGCLKTDAMIDAASDKGQTVITICNYEHYQAPQDSSDAASDAASDALPTQQRRKEEEGNNLNNTLTIVRGDSPPSDGLSDEGLNAVLWKQAKAYMVAQGVPKSTPWGVFRNLAKTYGDEALNQAIVAMPRAKPADPVSWLTAACKDQGARSRPLPDDFALTDDLREYCSAKLPLARSEEVFSRFCKQAISYNWKRADWPVAFMLHVDEQNKRAAR